MTAGVTTHEEIRLTRDSAACLRALIEGDLQAATGKLERLMRACESKVVPERELTELGSIYAALTSARDRLGVLVKRYPRSR